MAGRGEHMASERRMDSAELKRHALELRKAGADYRTIADRLGISVSSAHKAVMTALKAITAEPAAEVRELELARIDAMILGVWQRAVKGDDAAIRSVLRCMQRRAALLGLDAPKVVTGELVLRSLSDRAAIESGLDPGMILAEAERILVESSS